MKVQDIKLVRNDNSLTNQLYLNGILIANRFNGVDLTCNLMQLDVCKMCDSPGCSDMGYIEVLEESQTIIWKEPVNHEYKSAVGLRSGSIFWDKQDYIKLTRSNISDTHRNLSPDVQGITVKNANDLWRIHGSKCYMPNYHHSYSLEDLEGNLLGMYALDFSEEKCYEIYKYYKNHWKSYQDVKLINVTEEMKKITLMFDTPNYKEWDCLYYHCNNFYYSIGDNYLVSCS